MVVAYPATAVGTTRDKRIKRVNQAAQLVFLLSHNTHHTVGNGILYSSFESSGGSYYGQRILSAGNVRTQLACCERRDRRYQLNMEGIDTLLLHSRYLFVKRGLHAGQ